MRRSPVLVLGVGNELFTDEGLGVAAAHRLAADPAAGRAVVEVLDGGTLGLALLPEIADREAVLVLDAILADGAAPGELVVLHDDEVTQAGALLISAHQLGVAEALAAADFAGRRPRRLAAVGMVPACLDTGYGLSPTAAAGLDRLVRAAQDILAEWGYADRT